MPQTLISQSGLNLWVTCPRKFQHHFFDSLAVPSSLESKERMELGERFHLLMQQQELGLNVHDLANSDKDLQRWLRAFEVNPPTMIAGDRYPEHIRTLEFLQPSYVLTAVYDLLIFGTDQAQILDWKTHHRPLSPLTLESNWQTRLYLYLVATTTSYVPEQISMTYWFANTSDTVVIAYNHQKHHQTHQDLTEILTEMTLSQANQDFRQLPKDSEECLRCDFRYRCERDAQAQNSGAIASYPEVALSV